MKLLEFQKRVEAIKKDSKNPFFKSNYFDINSLLAEIKPLLNELGFILTQPLEVRDGKNVLTTYITDSADGETISSCILLPDLQDPQKLGSAITYLRRYSLQTLLGLQAEDDDGNLASKKEFKTPAQDYQESVYSITIKSCKTLKDLQETWATIPDEAKTKELVALKDDLKTKLK